MKPPALLCAALIALAGCGGSSPNANTPTAAVQAWFKALRDHDTKTYCAKTFLSSDLTAALAKKAGVPGGSPGNSRGWDAEVASCDSQFGKHGEYTRLRLPTIRVVSSTVSDVNPSQDGITGIAHVRVTSTRKSGGALIEFGGLTAVRFRGDWKVVFIVG